MKNIDKVREMTPEELIAFMKSHNCHKCSYNNTNCQHDMCTDGMTKWLEQEAELTIEDVSLEFGNYCSHETCSQCVYTKAVCQLQFTVRNFNIIDGKITRR